MSDTLAGVQPVQAEDTYQLRHHILRPQQTLADCAYDLDKAPGSYHVGYYLNGELVGVGSVFQEAMDGTTGGTDWRVRGMAVSERMRGQGIGARLLHALIRYAVSKSVPGTIWCNGRVNARSLYERAGFEQVGDVHDLPPLGPHVLLSRQLTEGDRSVRPKNA